MAKTVSQPQMQWHATDSYTNTRGNWLVRVLGYVVPVALVALSCILRFYRIDHESLWLDEGYTLLFSGLPLDRLIVVGGAHEHPPLYYLLVHGLMSAYHSYLAPRLLSAACGALSVAALYALGKHVGGRIAGLVAAFLLAVSPFHVWYGQDGRGYELAGLAVILSYLTGFRALDLGRTRSWAVYAGCTALCLYCEYTTTFALLPQVLFFVRARQSRQVRGLLVAWAAAIVAFLPWLGVLAVDAASIAGNYWIPPPNASTVANTILEFLGVTTPCAATPCTGATLPLPWLTGHEVPACALVVLATLLVGLYLVRSADFVPCVLFLWLVTPFVLVLLISLGQSLYLDRVFLDATFPLYVLLGLGATQIRRWTMLPAALVGVIVGGASVASLGTLYSQAANPEWRAAARDFAGAYRQGQAVIYNPGVLRSLVESYLPTNLQPTRVRSLWSRSYVDVPGWQRYYPALFHPSRQQRAAIEARLRERQLAETARGERDVWLITFDYPGLNDTRHWFTAHGFQLVLSQLYRGDTRIELWSRGQFGALGHVVVSDIASPSGWHLAGRARIQHGVATVDGAGTFERGFAIRPGQAYGVAVDYRGVPPTRPLVSLAAYDSGGKLIDVFPRTQWYDWPTNGVWLSQPFGFVAPPHATRAVLRLQCLWGHSEWRHLAVYAGL